VKVEAFVSGAVVAGLVFFVDLGQCFVSVFLGLARTLDGWFGIVNS